MNEPVNQTLANACNMVYNSNREDKGDSWLYLDTKYLMKKLTEEFQEVLDSWHKKDGCEGCLLRRELLDVINVSAMLYHRLGEEIK